MTGGDYVKKCNTCGYKNDDSNAHCQECGAKLSNLSTRSANTAEKEEKITQSFSKKKLISLITAAILVIGLFTSYQLLSKKYSKEAVTEKFKMALVKKDKAALKELIVPADSRLKVNNQSLDALFALIDKEPSLIQYIENSLHEEGLGNNLFYVREDGKHYGIFTRYVIDTISYFITLTDSVEGMTVYLNDNEITVLNGSQETKEFGPFLAGLYTVKGIHKEKDKKEEIMNIKLAGTQTATTITFQPEEENIEERTVIKEVIREVPSASGSYYLIPHSDYTYLTYPDISGFSKKELRIARNEIYARYGYIFESKDLQNYFKSQSWYIPNPSYNGDLSAVEKYNVDFIKSFE